MSEWHIALLLIAALILVGGVIGWCEYTLWTWYYRSRTTAAHNRREQFMIVHGLKD